MKRQPMSRSKSKRLFRNTAMRTHALNAPRKTIMRGGYRL